jgi:hypothetical protein
MVTIVKHFIIFLVLIQSAQCLAVSICESTMSIETRIISEAENKDNSSGKEIVPLKVASVFDGHYTDMVLLRPVESKKFDLYEFNANLPRDIWIECEYGFSKRLFGAKFRKNIGKPKSCVFSKATKVLTCGY